MTTKVFTDLNLLFGLNVYPELIYNEDVIRQSIYSILVTPIGTRLFRPDYGSFLTDLLHEPITDVSENQVEVFCIQAIEKWEPRVTINPEKTRATKVSDGFQLEIHYKINATNRESNLSFTAVR